MAAVWTTQYQPISNAETCTYAPVSVRTARDFCDSINNSKRYAMCDKVLCHMSPVPTDSDKNGSTDEIVMLEFAARYIPQGPTRLRFALGHVLANGDGQTTWRLYSLPTRYRGTATMDTTRLPTGYAAGSIISTPTLANAHNVHHETMSIARATDDTTWFVLTAQNNIASSYSRITTLDAWPVWA